MKFIKNINSFAENEYLFSVGCKISGVIIGILYIVILNRFLGTALKGEYAVISNYLNILAIIARMGMDEAYPVFRNREQHSAQIYLGNIKSVVLFWCIIVVFLANMFSFEFDKKIVLYLLPIEIAASCINYAVQVEYPKRKNISYITLNLVYLVFVTALLFCSKANIYHVVAIISLKSVMTLILACRNININVLKLKCRIAEIKPYIMYGFFPMLSVLLMTINYRVDIIMLEDKVPLQDIGIYSLAVNLADKVWLVPDALKEILVSKLTKGRTECEVAKVIRISLFCTLITCLGYIAFGRVFVNTLFGHEFLSAYSIMLVLLLGVFPMIFYKMIYAFNVVYGYKMVNFNILFSSAILNIALNKFLIPIMGVLGAAWTSVFSYSLSGILFALYFNKKVRLPYREMILIKKQDFVNIRSIFLGEVVYKYGKEKDSI